MPASNNTLEKGKENGHNETPKYRSRASFALIIR
jgi:hypothetical protein